MAEEPVMQSALFPFHKALVERCNSDEALMEVITGLHEEYVPEGTKLPYVIVGEPNADTVLLRNAKYQPITFTFHVWSQSPSKMETYDIQNKLTAALTRSPLKVEGRFLLRRFRILGETVVADADGNALMHGILRIRAQIFQY